MRAAVEVLARPRLLVAAPLVVVLAGSLVATAVADASWTLVPAAVCLAPVLRHLSGPVRPATAAALVLALGLAWLTAPTAPTGVALVATLVLAAGLGLLWRADVTRLEGRRHDAERRAAALSVRDDLTGCTNAHGLQMFGEQVLAAVRRRGDSAHAVLVEVAGLAHVRARCGPTAAEEVLAAVADALRSSTRGTDVVARLGEDVFAVVGPGSGTVPAELERRVRVHLLDAPPVHPADWPCRVTAGSAVLEPWDAGPLSDLLRRAEEDLSLRRALRAPSAPEPPLPHRSRQRRP
jgi:diguanylate cyclase (GGDEF)-like protein